MKIIIKSTIFLIILALLVACESTRAQAVEQYKEPFAQKRKQLAAIAESLPPVGSVLENSYCKNMNPALVLNYEASKDELTGSMLMYEQILDPDIDLSSFDVSMLDPFLLALRWTGPKNPMGPSEMREYDDKFPKRLEAALSTPYLVVNRIEEYIPARLIDTDSFLPGRVAIEGFVIAMENSKILCSYRIEVTTSAKTVYYKKNSNRWNQYAGPAERLQDALEKDARLAIQRTLTEITGGTIKYNPAYLPQTDE